LTLTYSGERGTGIFFQWDGERLSEATKIGMVGGQSMGKGPETWNEGHEHGEKGHNTHGDIFGRLPRQVVRSSQKKPPKMCAARGQDLRSAPVAMIFTSTSGRF